MTRSTRILAETVFSASCLLVCLASAALGRPTVRVTVKWPRLVRAWNAVDAWGRAAHARVGSRSVLEQRLASDHWSVVAVSRIREGQFELWWQPKASGNVTVRVVIVHDGSPLASNAAHVEVMPRATPPARRRPFLLHAKSTPTPEAHLAPEPSLPRTEVVPGYCAEPPPHGRRPGWRWLDCPAVSICQAGQHPGRLCMPTTLPTQSL